MQALRITVIGTINKDLILPFRSAPIESFGGIFYDIAILAQLLGESDEIVPVSYIGEDVLPTVQAVLKKLPGVSQAGLIPLPEKNHKVILEYTSPQRRQEKSLFRFPPLSWQQIAPFLEADIIIVNMISGWDIDKAAYLKLSQAARERLYLDVHYLLMGVDEMGRRFLRRPEEGVEEWLAGSRFVQMNEEEYRLLAAESRNEVDFFQRYCKDDQVLLITRAVRGATIVYQRDGMVGHKNFPAWRVSRLVDSTGCGDAFGAGFVVKYLETGKVPAAVEFANLVAAANLSLKGTNEMHRLLETMAQIRAENEREA